MNNQKVKLPQNKNNLKNLKNDFPYLKIVKNCVWILTRADNPKSNICYYDVKLDSKNHSITILTLLGRVSMEEKGLTI